MADQNSSKRLAQNNNEQNRKDDASIGVMIAVVVILIGIAAGIYLYNRPASTIENTTPVNTTTSPNNSTQQ